MNIIERDEGPVAVITLQGRIMSDTDVTEILDTIKSSIYNNRQKIVLDLSGVDWINSSGLGMFIAAQDLLREINGKLRLAGPADSVLKLININRLHTILDIHPSVDTAIDGM
jgi:anti-sigma B factor antagonist